MTAHASPIPSALVNQLNAHIITACAYSWNCSFHEAEHLLRTRPIAGRVHKRMTDAEWDRDYSIRRGDYNDPNDGGMP